MSTALKSCPVAMLMACALAVSAGAPAFAGPETARVATTVDLANLSIEELANIEVTSVSKRAEPLSEAAAAIYVISHDDIVRSGAVTVPEMLRLAPNLEVIRTSDSRYIVTARGFSGNTGAQAFSNKLLVLIDGRSVYTPLFSGVYWDMQDVLPQDIERIEVISGPGATLWGANAVNGVVNIITRSSADSQGLLATGGEGARERHLGVRYGGMLGADTTYRIYARAFNDDDSVDATGAPAGDGWYRVQGGFRVDWAPAGPNAVTVQGDAYHGSDGQLGSPDEKIDGRNLTARWTRTGGDGSELRVQAYYDRTERGTQGSGQFAVNTFDLDLQHSFSLGSAQQVVWGAGARASRYNIQGTSSLFFVPAKRSLNLGNAFVQDTISLNPQTRLIVGLKVEDDPYVKPTLLPNVRMSWTPARGANLWAAVSRAVRSPTPFDRDVVEQIGSVVQLRGDADFQHEKLTAYEVGARLQPASTLSLSVSTYYNQYDDLRTIEITPVVFIPLTWGNGMKGHTYGLEASADLQALSWWRLSAGFDAMHEDLTFKPGASGILGAAQAGDDPKYQAQLRSSMDLPHDVTLDAALRYVSTLPDPRIPSYVELNGRIAWDITDHVQIGVSGQNLLHDNHLEFPGGNAVPRTVLADLQLRF